MRKRKNIIMAILGPIVISSGCVKAISKELRAQVEEGIYIEEVIKNPKAYQNKMVLWGGVIVDAKNLKEGTSFEIVQKPVNSEGRPKNVDKSGGRFLALHDGFVDVAIYSVGREVTVAGTVKEIQVKLLGEIEYSYPVISVKEIHLWPARSEKKYIVYPYWYDQYWYDPYWHYYPHRWWYW